MAIPLVRPERGVLLVARPHLLDPNFMHTVVLLCDHEEEGSLGFVLNRPAERGLHQVLQGDHDFGGRTDAVYLGGPVGRDSLAILHREDGVPGTVEVLPGLYLGGNPRALGRRVRARPTPPGQVRFLVGYSGWGKGQLAREIEEDTWVLAPGDASWVFDPEPKTLWRRVLRSLGGDEAMLANFPVDPSVN